MNYRKIFNLLWILIALSIGFMFLVIACGVTTGALAQSRYCSSSALGEGWTTVDGSNFVRIPGADKYCVSTGDQVQLPPGEGCLTFSMRGNFEEMLKLVNYKGGTEAACKLDHWAYRGGTPPEGSPSTSRSGGSSQSAAPKIVWTEAQLMGIDILISIIHSPDIPPNIGEAWAAQYPGGG